jgi:hypothetical protein
MTANKRIMSNCNLKKSPLISLKEGELPNLNLQH